MVNSNTFSPYCLFKCLAFPIYVLSNSHSCWGKEIEEIWEALYAKILCSRIRACGMCIKDLNIYKGVGGNAYTNFFSLVRPHKGLATLYRYYSTRNNRNSPSLQSKYTYQ